VTDLLERVEQNIQNRRLLKRGQAVLVAVSGGLDSITLLHALRQLSSRHRWHLTVAHFNHQLRGRSSDADEKLVRQTAAAMRLPFIAGRADVKAFAQKSKLSIEMAARKLRHDFFARAAKERKIRVIALAHHADDQVELFFLRILRGAGGEGLAGMKWRSPSPVNSKITLVRPLLDATKGELRGFTRKYKIRFRDDATNTSLEMPRNRVRNELLPLLRRSYQPALTRTVLRLMEIVGAESEFVGETARRWLAEHARDAALRRPLDLQVGRRCCAARLSGSSALPEGSARGYARPTGECDFTGLPIAVQRRALQLQLSEAGVPADFELIESLRQSADVPISLSHELSVLRDATGAVSLRLARRSDFNAREMVVRLAGRAGDVEFDGVRFGWRLEAGAKFARPHGRKACEFFCADKVGGRITLRHWRPGDRFQPIGMKSPVKLQDLFTNRKIPRARRRELIVATAANGEIFWVEGLRISENFKLISKTKRCLIWRWQCLA
jgi:tRNA(Ile)-lysidine synthase